MIEKGVVSENEMVWAFLKSEVDSSIFQKRILECLAESGISREEIIDNPDFTNEAHNKTRLKFLDEARNYSSRTRLFQDFPIDIIWRRIELTPEEFKILKYLKHGFWGKLSDGSRLVVDGAKNIDRLREDEKEKIVIDAIVEELKNGKVFTELIAVDDNADGLILIEGHKRATAHMLSGLNQNIEIIVGSSPEMSKWKHY